MTNEPTTDPTAQPPEEAAGLSPEELAEAHAIELPEREALSIVTGGLPSGAGSTPLVGSAEGELLVGDGDELRTKPETGL